MSTINIDMRPKSESSLLLPKVSCCEWAKAGWQIILALACARIENICFHIELAEIFALPEGPLFILTVGGPSGRQIHIGAHAKVIGLGGTEPTAREITDFFLNELKLRQVIEEYLEKEGSGPLPE